MAHRAPPSPRVRRDPVRAAASFPARFVRRGRGPVRKALRTLLLLVLVLLIPLGWSYVDALTAIGSAPWQIRTVEWISNDLPGGRTLVLSAERFWYSWHTPPVGGTPSGGLPYLADPPTPAPKPTILLPPHLPAPHRIPSIASPPLRHEGQWQAVGRQVDGIPAIRVAFLRPDTVHTSLVAGVMWMDTKLLQGVLVPGTQVPAPGIAWNGPHWDVAPNHRATLAATFNAGFLMSDARGGWYSQGKMVVPLVKGAASLVFFKNGDVTVGQWGQGRLTMGPDVASVRQNLSLIIQNGKPVPSLSSNNFLEWGATLGNALYVWRSGIGVTKNGALVYAGGPGLSIQSLANVLVHAGAVRAMELDINTDWVSAYTYRKASHSPWKVTPTKLLSSMIRVSTRYLVPDERDFVAMYLRPQYLKPPWGTLVTPGAPVASGPRARPSPSASP